MKGLLLLVFLVLSGMVSLIDGKATDPFLELENNFKHAQTYYWYGRSRQNSLNEIELSALYLDKAKKQLDKLTGLDSASIVKRNLLLAEFTELEETLEAMREICIDNLNGRYPLYMELSGRSDEFEYWDDANELALENAVAQLLEIPYPIRPLGEQMRFFVLLSVPDDVLLKEVAMQYISVNSDLTSVGEFSLLEFISKDELQALKEGRDNSMVLGKICRGLEINEIGIFDLVKEDDLNNLFYWTAGFRTYSVNTSFSPYVRADGFSNDKSTLKGDALKWLVIFMVLLGLGFWLILYFVLLIRRDPATFREKIRESSEALVFFFFSMLAGIILSILLLLLVRPILPPSDDFFQATTSRFIWRLMVPIIFSMGVVASTYILGSRFFDKRLHQVPSLFGLVSGSSFAYIILLIFHSVIKFGSPESLGFLPPAIGLIFTYSFVVALYYREYLEKRNLMALRSLILVIPTVFLTCYHMLLNVEGLGLSAFRWLWISTPLILGVVLKEGYGFWWRIENKKKSSLVKKDRNQVSDTRELKLLFEDPAQYVSILSEVSGERKMQDFLDMLFTPADKTRILLLHGARGAGKTRLIREFKKDIELNNEFVVFYGDCDEFQDSNAIPYEPFVEAMSEFMGEGAFSNHNKKVAEYVNMIKEVDLGPVSALAGFIGSGENLNDGADAQDVSAEILKIFRKLLVSGKKVLLVIEDIQWSDDTTEWLLNALVKSLCANGEAFGNLRILLTMRADDSEQVKQNVVIKELRKIDESLLEMVNLSEYSGLSFDYGDYFSRLMDVNHVSMNYYSALKLSNYFKSNDFKVPLHYNQIMINILDRGWIVKDHDEFKLISKARLDELLPPDELSKLYREKFSKLDPEMLKILIAAAYIGMSFEARILASVWWGIENAENRILDLFHSLQKAENLGLVIDISEADDVYEFTSRGLMAELRAYTKPNQDRGASVEEEEAFIGFRLPQAVKEYHKRIISAIEAYKGDKADLDINILCSVAKRSRFLDIHSSANLERIISYNTLAGDRCFRAGRLDEAINYYSYTWSVLSQDDLARKPGVEGSPVNEILLKLIQAYLDTSQTEKARVLLDDHRFRKTGQHAAYLNLKALISYRDEALEEVNAILDEFDSIPAEQVSPYHRFRAGFNRILGKGRDAENSIQELEALLAEIKKYDDPGDRAIMELRGEVLNSIASKYIYQGSPMCLQYLDERLSLILKMKDEPFPFSAVRRKEVYTSELHFQVLSPHEKVSLKFNTGSYARFFQAGEDSDTALFFVNEALKVNQALGDSFGMALYTKSLADCLVKIEGFSYEEVFNYYYEAYWTAKLTGLDERFYQPVVNGLKRFNEEGKLDKAFQISKIDLDYPRVRLKVSCFTREQQWHVLRHFSSVDPLYARTLQEELSMQDFEKVLLTPGSKFNPGFCNSPAALWEKITSSGSWTLKHFESRDDQHFEYTLEFPEELYPGGIGWDSLVHVDQLSERERNGITMEPRGDYEARVVHLDKKIPSREINIILEKENHVKKVITIFPGKPAPPFPDRERQDDKAFKKSSEFWNSHVFLLPHA